MINDIYDIAYSPIMDQLNSNQRIINPPKNKVKIYGSRKLLDNNKDNKLIRNRIKEKPKVVFNN